MAFVYRYPPGIHHGSGWLHVEPHFTLQRDSFFPHAHTFAELTLVSEGKGRHRCAGKGHLTQAGDLIFCPPGLVHQYVDSEGQTHRNIHFDPELLSALKREVVELHVLEELFPGTGAPTRHLRLDVKELAAVELALREIEAEQKEARPGKNAAIRLLFQRFLLQLGRLAEQRASLREKGKRPASTGLATARRLIHDEAAKDHTVESLAKVAGLSPSHFRRLFRQAYGDSPIKLLIRERVRASCRPLEIDDLTVTEIAFKCGFQDGNYFSRQFKQIMGTNPLQYREMFRQGK